MVKPIALLATAGVFCLAAGYALGRYAAPARVEERERVVTQTVEVAAKQKEESRVQTSSVAQRNETRWRVVYRRSSDGAVEATAESEAASQSQAAERDKETKREVEVRYVDRKVEVERLKIVEAAKPQWSVAAGAGLQAGPRAVYRGQVERRIIGPIWAGVYATTSKEIGAQVRFEW